MNEVDRYMSMQVKMAEQQFKLIQEMKEEKAPPIQIAIAEMVEFVRQHHAGIWFPDDEEKRFREIIDDWQKAEQALK